MNFYSTYFKRPIGFFGALAGLCVTLPVILLSSILLLFANRGAGVFFLQSRPGRDEKIFKLIKFKTMTDERDEHGVLLPDAQRITKIGRAIRSCSIDELPQLVNILKGDMAFIGPRPLLINYLPLYAPEQHRRHNVRPGISGWAQVNGRNAISWHQKFEYDIWYVDNLSFKIDFEIFFRTVDRVFKRSDISSATSATMEAFNGHN